MVGVKNRNCDQNISYENIIFNGKRNVSGERELSSEEHWLFTQRTWFGSQHPHAGSQPSPTQAYGRASHQISCAVHSHPGGKKLHKKKKTF